MSHEIANRIKQARINAKLSTTEVSKKTGISEGNLSEWESGHFNPSTKNLILLSEVFNVSIDWLLKGESAKLFEMNDNNKAVVSLLRGIYEEWERSDEETRSWITVQLKRAFPEIVERLKEDS